MSFDKKKKLPPKVENMTKEELMGFLQKKKECESVAHSIVIELLENGVKEERLLICLPHINQCHYDDIVEERAIAKQCGYPICMKSLPDKLPSQQFKISSKTNRVFDITVRKNFCSNGCYKASLFLKEQLSISPLWCRDLEDKPSFTLMPIDTVGLLGEEINLSLTKKVDVEASKDFKSLFDFTEASLTEISQDDKCQNINLDTVEVTSHKGADGKEEKPTEQVGGIETDKDENKQKKVCEETNAIDESKKKFIKKSIGSKIVGDVVERQTEKKVDPIISEGMKLMSLNKAREKEIQNKEKKSKAPQRNVQPITLAIVHIEKCICEWFTLETMLYLFGEERVKEIVTDKGECIKEYLNNMASGLFYKSTSYDQYQQLCRKLNLLELEDRRYDGEITPVKELKPLPHYSMLQEESKKLQIKVRAFIKGEMEIPNEKIEVIDEENNQNEFLPNLPLADKTSQMVLRRKIVLNGLNKVLPDLLQLLGVRMSEINNDLRLLVATFHLQAHNIVFKRQQWSIIALIVVKLLSVKDVRLRKVLEKDQANRHIQLLLLSYEQDGGYLDRVVIWLTDVDRLLDKTNSQLTLDGTK